MVTHAQITPALLIADES